MQTQNIKINNSYIQYNGLFKFETMFILITEVFSGCLGYEIPKHEKFQNIAEHIAEHCRKPFRNLAGNNAGTMQGHCRKLN